MFFKERSRYMLCVAAFILAAVHRPLHATDVAAHLTISGRRATSSNAKLRPAVIWLKPVEEDFLPKVKPGRFTLLQKNKTFTPHLLVVPINSSVIFPNADPFYHNVFSLFDGRRFDLGLYEAGSARSVVFSREGVSYIFCNIHSEMSAVVIALDTPMYSIVDSKGEFHINGLPAGDYDLHIWVEGEPQSVLDRMTRRIHVAGESMDLGDIHAGQREREQHLNKFGRPYEPSDIPAY